MVKIGVLLEYPWKQIVSLAEYAPANHKEYTGRTRKESNVQAQPRSNEDCSGVYKSGTTILARERCWLRWRYAVRAGAAPVQLRARRALPRVVVVDKWLR